MTMKLKVNLGKMYDFSYIHPEYYTKIIKTMESIWFNNMGIIKMGEIAMSNPDIFDCNV